MKLSDEMILVIIFAIYVIVEKPEKFQDFNETLTHDLVILV